MKKIILILLCSFGFLHLFAQGYINLEKEIKPGTKLRYLITINDSQAYNFTVTVKKLTPAVEFDWAMDKENPSSGTIINTPKGMQSAIYLQNYFRDGEERLDDNTVSVWLSKKLFNSFSTNKEKATEVGLYGPGQPLVLMSVNNTHDGSVLINGSVAILKQITEGTLKKEGNKLVHNGEGYLTFYPSAKIPLIINMHTKFDVSLEEIMTQ